MDMGKSNSFQQLCELPYQLADAGGVRGMPLCPILPGQTEEFSQ